MKERLCLFPMPLISRAEVSKRKPSKVETTVRETVSAKSRRYVSQLVPRSDPHQPPARPRRLVLVVVGLDLGHIPLDKTAALGVPNDASLFVDHLIFREALLGRG
jgi:hypothetical protein